MENISDIKNDSWYIIGISGAPFTYRKEIAKHLYGILPRCTTEYIFQGRYFYHPLDHTKHEPKNEEWEGSDHELNYETIKSVDVEAMFKAIKRVLKKTYNLGSHKSILILEGHRLYDDPRIRQLVDLPVLCDMSNNKLYSRYIENRTSDRRYVTDYIVKYYSEYRSRCLRDYKHEIVGTLIQMKADGSYEENKALFRAILYGRLKLNFVTLDFEPRNFNPFFENEQ